MKSALIFLIAFSCGGCVSQKTPGALVGTYNNDSVVDTRERIWLKPDGRSAYEITFYNGGKSTERDEGRWEVSGTKVVLWTRNDQKEEVQVVFDIMDYGPDAFLLELDSERRDKTANIPMFGGVYRRISKEAPSEPPEPNAAPITSRTVLEQLQRDLEAARKKPNKAPEPTTTSGTSAAEQPLVPAAVVAHL